MKLYATVVGMKNGTQVEKGQGSNQSLAIEILAEGLQGIPTRANQYRISLNVGNNNELQAEILDYSTGETTQLTKGEKQKGECEHQRVKYAIGQDKCTKCGLLLKATK